MIGQFVYNVLIVVIKYHFTCGQLTLFKNIANFQNIMSMNVCVNKFLQISCPSFVENSIQMVNANLKCCNSLLSTGRYFSCLLMLKTVIIKLLTLVGGVLSIKIYFLSQTTGFIRNMSYCFRCIEQKKNSEITMEIMFWKFGTF